MARILGVGYFIAFGRVINGPASGPNTDLATKLLDDRDALPRRDNLQVVVAASLAEPLVSHDPMTVGLEMGQNHIACMGRLEMTIEGKIAIQVRLQSKESLPHPSAPSLRTFVRRKAVSSERKFFFHDMPTLAFSRD